MMSSRLDGDEDEDDGGFYRRRRHLILIHRNMRLHSIGGTCHILSKTEIESEIEVQKIDDGRLIMLLLSWKTSTAMRIPKVQTMQL